MTYTDIVSEARALLQDTVITYRYSDTEMYGHVRRAVQSLFAIRPTAFFIDGEMPDTAAALECPTVAEAEAAGGEVTVPVGHGDRYQQALVYFVAAKCLERDSSDTQNSALSATYMQSFAAFAKM